MTRRLLELGAELGRQGSDGMTPLHYACRCPGTSPPARRYGRNVTERSMAGRTDYEGEDPGLDTVRVLVEEDRRQGRRVTTMVSLMASFFCTF